MQIRIDFAFSLFLCCNTTICSLISCSVGGPFSDVNKHIPSRTVFKLRPIYSFFLFHIFFKARISVHNNQFFIGTLTFPVNIDFAEHQISANTRGRSNVFILCIYWRQISDSLQYSNNLDHISFLRTHIDDLQARQFTLKTFFFARKYKCQYKKTELQKEEFAKQGNPKND